MGTVLVLELIPAILAVMLFVYSRRETARLREELQQSAGADVFPVLRIEVPQSAPAAASRLPARHVAPPITRIIPIIHARAYPGQEPTRTFCQPLWN